MTRKPTAEDIAALQKAVDLLRAKPEVISEQVITSLAKFGESSEIVLPGEFEKALQTTPLFVLLSWALALANIAGEMIEGTGDPTGRVTPGFAGQLFHDNVSGAYYHSISAEQGGWVLLGEVKNVVQINITIPS
jgi:hypothetical protein